MIGIPFIVVSEQTMPGIKPGPMTKFYDFSLIKNEYYETIVLLQLSLINLDYQHTRFRVSSYFLTLTYPHVLWLLRNSNHIANAGMRDFAFICCMIS
jgi:hypothetical protein